jgi:DNA-binding NarL/FixJ family response regulator
VTVRVVIADDQLLVQAGFPKLLDTEPDISVVGQAGDGVEAVAQAVWRGRAATGPLAWCPF